MNGRKRLLGMALVAIAIVGSASVASAQEQQQQQDDNMRPATNRVIPEPQQPLPPPQSDYDPQPPVAEPGPGNEVGVTAQAGVGGTQAYGRAGVLELGGNLGLAAADDFTQFNISPSVGWFVADNFELSGIIGAHYINAGGEDSGFLTVLAEPSYHLPFTDTVFGFIGLGTGISYAEDPGIGFALAPRLGMNVMVGRSGVLTPALQVIYSTSDAIQTSQGTVIAVNTSFGANVGYTVMW